MSRRTDPAMPKELRPLIKKARAQGWTLEGGGRRHYKLRNPKGDYAIVFAASGSDQREIKHLTTRLRRAGCDV